MASLFVDTNVSLRFLTNDELIDLNASRRR